MPTRGILNCLSVRRRVHHPRFVRGGVAVVGGLARDGGAADGAPTARHEELKKLDSLWASGREGWQYSPDGSGPRFAKHERQKRV